MSTSKCTACKGTIIKSYPYDSSYIIVDKQLFHTSCYAEKKQRAKNDKWSKEETPERIEELVRQTKADLEYENTSEQLIRFLEKQYGIVFIPTFFFEKLKSINNGTLKGLAKPIPLTDLLDMWEIKIDWLKKQGLKKWKGSSVEALTRINYDLAILMGKYQSYLDWKNGIRIEEEIEKENAQKPKIIQFRTDYATQNNRQKKDNIVSSALDDLFK